MLVNYILCLMPTYTLCKFASLQGYHKLEPYGLEIMFLGNRSVTILVGGLEDMSYTGPDAK